jgi:hypothetical protein
MRKTEERRSSIFYFVREVEWFREGVPSTAENLTIFIWNQLVDKIPPPARLYEVRHLHIGSTPTPLIAKK